MLCKATILPVCGDPQVVVPQTTHYEAARAWHRQPRIKTVFSEAIPDIFGMDARMTCA
jgi:hypothetical protein